MSEIIRVTFIKKQEDLEKGESSIVKIYYVETGDSFLAHAVAGEEFEKDGYNLNNHDVAVTTPQRLLKVD